MRSFIFSLILLAFAIGNCQAGALKDEYELKKKCGEEAARYFSDMYGNGIKKTDTYKSIISYKNHYNKKKNTCFILISDITFYNDKSLGPLKIIDLIDVHDNDRIAQLADDKKNIGCEFAGVGCKSKEEFDRLIKPYMTQ